MEIDTETLIDYGITPNQFILLYLVYQNNYAEADRIINTIGYNNSLYELEDANKKGFINLQPSGEKSKVYARDIKLRKKFTFVLGGSDYFDELLEEYPVKVVRPDGVKDYLRSDLKRCKRNYDKIATTRKKHEEILESLKYEKKVRDQEDSWKYMKKLPKWLSSEEWKTFLERMRDEGQEAKEQPKYGQQLE